jgi:retron-type reverse transcriptase
MYHNIVSIENLLEAWREFLKGKRTKKDVQGFQYRLSDHIIDLHNNLKNKTYSHDGYFAFNISDPKPRNIHKATVRDRLLHHAVYRKLYSLFDIKFIFDSYSCRKYRGTHRALKRFRDFLNIASKNNTKTLWILKCDIRKFFASIDHKILFKILEKSICDIDVSILLKEVVNSFSGIEIGKGLPLGNLTSQLLANVYMNEFDQYIKHELKVKYYIRYADDFVIMNTDRSVLVEILEKIKLFLHRELMLELHPDKISIETAASGIDFLGWVHFPDHKVLRTVTKRRMLKRIEHRKNDTRTLQSYLGLLRHGNTDKIKQKIMKYDTFK